MGLRCIIYQTRGVVRGTHSSLTYGSIGSTGGIASVVAAADKVAMSMMVCQYRSRGCVSVDQEGVLVSITWVCKSV